MIKIKKPKGKNKRSLVGECRGNEINRTSLYLLGLSQGKTKRKAALDAGFSASSANNPAHSIESTEKFKNAQGVFSRALIKHGITIDSICKALAEMLKKRTAATGFGKEYIGTQIDSASAKMAIDIVAKILGWYAPEKEKKAVVADLRDIKALTERELDEELRKMMI